MLLCPSLLLLKQSSCSLDTVIFTNNFIYNVMSNKAQLMIISFSAFLLMWRFHLYGLLSATTTQLLYASSRKHRHDMPDWPILRGLAEYTVSFLH